jgi:hypothetical protein
MSFVGALDFCVAFKNDRGFQAVNARCKMNARMPALEFAFNRISCWWLTVCKLNCLYDVVASLLVARLPAEGYHEMLMGSERIDSANNIIAWIKDHLPPQGSKL